MAKNTGRNVALGALIAAGIGYAIGVLTAPKSGKETRADIKNAAQKARTAAEKNLKNLHSELSELISAGKLKAKDAKESARAELTEALVKAQAAKEKARNVLSAFHEGGVDDEDLQAAISDAKKALSNLKKYVTKNVKAA